MMAAEKHITLQRSLSLLRYLQRERADRSTLVDFVSVELGADVYPDLASKAGQRAFEEDIKRLRDFGIKISYDRTEGLYSLGSYGDFSPVCLTEAELDTVAFLSETFAPGAPNAEGVQQLLHRLTDWLPERQRDSLSTRRQRLRIDLRRKDEDQIDFRVQRAVERAVAQRRLLRFHYRSPGRADGLPRVHTVQPWELYFDSVRHHLYLDAYRLEVAGPFGVWTEATWTRYRLGRISAEALQILPDKFAPIAPKRPRYRLVYWLAPAIARLGEISHHFEEMAVGETDDAGWVQVTATTDDLFRAVRLLLSYGPNCRVTGGSEARREMVTLVEAMGAVYGE